MRLPERLVSRSPDREKASIIILTLWALCLLSAFAVTLSYGVRQKLLLVKRLDERDRLYTIADAAVKKAQFCLKKQEEKGYDALGDPWSNDASAFKDASVGDGKFSVSYEYTDEIIKDTSIRYGLIDEESKININVINSAVIERLIRGVLNCTDIEAQELAASIVDWRDADSFLSIPLGSAEDGYYKGLRYPYEAKDADFESFDEVLLVKGIDSEIFRKIKEYITVYGSGRVNINTASKAVLSALGISEKIVNDIFLFRAGEDARIGTSDDNVFDNDSSIVAKLTQRYQLSEAEAASLTMILERYLTSYSTAFTVKITARVANAKALVYAVSVIDRQGNILYWQES